MKIEGQSVTPFGESWAAGYKEIFLSCHLDALVVRQYCISVILQELSGKTCQDIGTGQLTDQSERLQFAGKGIVKLDQGLKDFIRRTIGSVLSQLKDKKPETLITDELVETLVSQVLSKGSEETLKAEFRKVTIVRQALITALAEDYKVWMLLQSNIDTADVDKVSNPGSFWYPKISQAKHDEMQQQSDKMIVRMAFANRALERVNCVSDIDCKQLIDQYHKILSAQDYRQKVVNEYKDISGLNSQDTVDESMNSIVTSLEDLTALKVFMPAKSWTWSIFNNETQTEDVFNLRNQKVSSVLKGMAQLSVGD